jgi:predicted nucleic acid-binding protein
VSVETFVLDASVAAKWFLAGPDETLLDEAWLLLERFQAGSVAFAVPDVFWPELGNVLWKAVRKQRITRRSAEEAIEKAVDFDFPTVPSRTLLRDSLQIAANFDRSFYDATYISAALHLKIPLLTADERLVNALASRFPVRWLGML